MPHVESIHQKIRYRCTVVGCDSEHVSKNGLKSHIDKVHRDVRKYSCEFCDKNFKTSVARKEHVMTHTGERPFTCGGCGKGFIQATPWKRHLMSVCGLPVPEKKKIGGNWVYDKSVMVKNDQNVNNQDFNRVGF